VLCAKKNGTAKGQTLPVARRKKNPLFRCQNNFSPYISLWQLSMLALLAIPEFFVHNMDISLLAIHSFQNNLLVSAY